MSDANDTRAAACLRRSRVDETRPGTPGGDAPEQAARAMAPGLRVHDPIVAIDRGDGHVVGAA